MLIVIAQYKDEISALTSIIAIIISFISILLTFISIRLQMRHNRNAIKPIIDFAIGDYDNDIFVRILNNGAGPLIVKSFEVYYLDSVRDDLISIMPELPKNMYWKTFFSRIVGKSIPQNQSITLIQLEINLKRKEEIEYRNLIREVLSLVEIKVLYADIYEINMPVVTKKLDWFGRTLDY